MSDELNNMTCVECGIEFGISKKVEALWRKSHKSFVCPNGHSLSWQDKTTEEKELDKLRTEVKALKEELASTKENLEKETKRADELAAELEIWKPSEKVE